MEGTAEGQQKRADGIKHIRTLAMLSRLGCLDVRSLMMGATNPLEVRSVPVLGNCAHCGIFNISGSKGDGYVTGLRSKLTQLCSLPITLDEQYGSASTTSDA